MNNLQTNIEYISADSIDEPRIVGKADKLLLVRRLPKSQT